MYLIINKVFCIVEEGENGVKYLKIEKNHCDPVINKWNQVFDSIKYQIKKINNEEVNFNDGFNKIKFICDDSLRLNELIYFPTLTVVIRCVFKKGDLFYPQFYLDDHYINYKRNLLFKMISYEKITGYNNKKEGAKCMRLNVKGNDYRIYISNIDKKEAIVIFKKI